MNLAERPGPPATNVNMNRNGRPITARTTVVQDNGRFSKLDFATSDLSSELNLAFGDSLGSTPTPPPNCPPPPPPQINNQNLESTTGEEDKPASDEAQSFPSLNPGQNNGQP